MAAPAKKTSFTLKFWYVPVIALVGQLMLIWLHGAGMVPEALLRAGIILTFLLLFGAIAANRRIPGIQLLAVGVALNFMVIASNGGLMPLSPETLGKVSDMEVGHEVFLGEHVPNSKDVLLAKEDTRLWWLSDVLVVRGFYPPEGIAFSIGDVFIASGVLAMLLFYMFHRLVTRKQPLYHQRG